MNRVTQFAAAAIFCGAAMFSAAQAAPLAPALPPPVGDVVKAGYFIAPDGTPEFVWRGKVYCFYPDGWRGPGWYWCGYAWREGYGWGGSPAWRPAGLVWRVRPAGPSWRAHGGWAHGWRGRPHHGHPHHGHPHHGHGGHGHHHHGHHHHGHGHGHGHGHHGRRR